MEARPAVTEDQECNGTTVNVVFLVGRREFSEVLPDGGDGMCSL